MALYERLMGWTEADAKIPVHQFTGIMGEFARGRLTGAQAQAAIVSVSGAPLEPESVTEAVALLATVTGAGNATARLLRALEIDHVLLLAEVRAAGYDTPAAIRARLVP